MRPVEQRDGRDRDHDSALETLKALRESTANRWEKRREYEWKLSFALWTAIAAFIAITIGKDNSIKTTAGVEIGVFIGAVMITGIHAAYLKGIIANTLNDLIKMERVEEAMRASLPKHVIEAESWPPQKFTRFDRHHGFLQALITGVLCAGAFFATMAPRNDKPAAAITSSPTPGITK